MDQVSDAIMTLIRSLDNPLVRGDCVYARDDTVFTDATYIGFFETAVDANVHHTLCGVPQSGCGGTNLATNLVTMDRCRVGHRRS